MKGPIGVREIKFTPFSPEKDHFFADPPLAICMTLITLSSLCIVIDLTTNTSLYENQSKDFY